MIDAKRKALFVLIVSILIAGSAGSFIYAYALQVKLQKEEENIKVLERKKKDSINKKLDKMLEDMLQRQETIKENL